MLSVGIDAHHQLYAMCILDDNGKLVKERTIEGSAQNVASWLKRLKEPFEVCYEASLGYGVLHDELTPIAHRVRVAHPAHVRAIFNSKRKNDRIDARKLAKCLYMDEVPEVHVPKHEVREWRVLIEHRRRMVDKRVATKNGLRAILRGQGIASPRGRTLWSSKGMQWVKGVQFKSPLTTLRCNQLVAEILHFDAVIKEVEKLLNAIAQRQPGVALLRTIPGIGPRTAEAIVAYVDDPQRFSSTRKAASYFGLVPCLDESAGVSRYGRITRQGPATVRKLVAEASWRAVVCSPTIRRFFDRIKGEKKERTGKALVATARHLVKVMVAMLKSGEEWRESPPEEAQRQKILAG